MYIKISKKVFSSTNIQHQTSSIKHQTSSIKFPILSYFQCAYGNKRESDCDHPESDNDLGLRPSFQFKMVMKGSHFKNSAAVCHLKKAHLKNNRQGFYDKKSAHQYQHYFLLCDNSHNTDDASQGKRICERTKQFQWKMSAQDQNDNTWKKVPVFSENNNCFQIFLRPQPNLHHNSDPHQKKDREQEADIVPGLYAPSYRRLGDLV